MGFYKIPKDKWQIPNPFPSLRLWAWEPLVLRTYLKFKKPNLKFEKNQKHVLQTIVDNLQVAQKLV